MTVGAIIALVIVLVLLAAAATLAGTLLLRRMALRHRFGSEYDQLARDVGPRRARAELAERRRRVARLNIRPLSTERRAGYGREWTAAQERFVDSPAQAVEAAAALVTVVAADRGYPVGDRARLLTDLSVYHAGRLDGYRRALRTAEQAGTAGTEDLRQALLACRALFRDLLGTPDHDGGRPAIRPAVRAGSGAAGADGSDGTGVTVAARAGGGREPRAVAPAAGKD